MGVEAAGQAADFVTDVFGYTALEGRYVLRMAVVVNY